MTDPTTTIDLGVFGVRVRVDGADDAFRDATRDLAVPAAVPDVVIQVGRDDDGWKWTDSEGRVVARIDTDLDPTERAVGVLTQLGLDHDDTHLHLHAALLDHHGAGLVVCGPSGAGKTTLAAMLVERGDRYLTDEAIALCAGSRTLDAYPKPLTLKGYSIGRFGAPGAEGAATRERVVRPASELGAIALRTTCDHIVFPAYDAGADTAAVEITRPEALRLLLSETLDPVRFGPEALDVLADLVSGARCWSLQYSRLDDAASTIHDLMRATPSVVPWRRGELGVRTRSVLMDGKVVMIDTDGQHVAISDEVEAASLNERLRPQPDGHTTAVRDALSRLRASRIDVVVCGDAIAMHDGPRNQVVSAPLASTLLVSAGDLAAARACTADLDLDAERVRVADRSGSDDGSAFLRFSDVCETARPFRFGSDWQRGLSPSARLVEACLHMGSAHIDGDLARRVVDRGQLPRRDLERALDLAERLGLGDVVVQSVVAAAHLLPGTSPTLAGCIRRRRSNSLATWPV